ncbi:MAG: 16S rRNA (guanine(966)-N(2))-methyltransferase RsmD, partial [Flavobacteriales bacterium]|nr:16S rRNA (guanine(966)-N(2))-methyltransferase RsmD [Flavobacteriales bacterium]
EDHHKIKEIIFERNLVKEDGCLIIEHDSSTLFEDDNIEVRKYGTVHFSIFSF